MHNDDPEDFKDVTSTEYVPREDWMLANTAWDFDTNTWDLPGTFFEIVGDSKHANFLYFQHEFPDLKMFEKEVDPVGITIESGELNDIEDWETFKEAVLLSNKNEIIDPYFMELAEELAIKHAWNTVYREEFIEALLDKFSSEPKLGEAAAQDIKLFMNTNAGFSFFCTAMDRNDEDWNMDSKLPSVNVDAVAATITWPQLMAAVYPEAGRGQLTLPLPESSDDEEAGEPKEDEISHFMRDLKTDMTPIAEEFLEENLVYDESWEMWELAGFSNFSGSCVDRANARYFHNKYPEIVTVKYGGYGSEVTGITRDKLEKVTPDDLAGLAADLKSLQNYPLLSESMHDEIVSEKRQQAWVNWLGEEFKEKLAEKFPYYGDAILNISNTESTLFHLFEHCCNAAGAEWTESDGGDQGIHDLAPVVACVQLEWVLARLPQAANEALITERSKFSIVMAPAPDDLANKVIQWGQMFVLDEELYTDPKEPTSFGREHEIHVTVKFGLHEAEPSDSLLRIIEETQPFEIEIGEISLFQNEKFTVVKFGVKGEGLRALNARISTLDNSDEHSDYTPHMTVAYVKPGAGIELIGKPLTDGAEPEANRFIVKSVVFRGAGPDKIQLFLGKPNTVLQDSRS